MDELPDDDDDDDDATGGAEEESRFRGPAAASEGPTHTRRPASISAPPSTFHKGTAVWASFAFVSRDTSVAGGGATKGIPRARSAAAMVAKVASFLSPTSTSKARHVEMRTAAARRKRWTTSAAERDDRSAFRFSRSAAAAARSASRSFLLPAPAVLAEDDRPEKEEEEEEEEEEGNMVVTETAGRHRLSGNCKRHRAVCSVCSASAARRR